MGNTTSSPNLVEKRLSAMKSVPSLRAMIGRCVHDEYIADTPVLEKANLTQGEEFSLHDLAGVESEKMPMPLSNKMKSGEVMKNDNSSSYDDYMDFYPATDSAKSEQSKKLKRLQSGKGEMIAESRQLVKKDRKKSNPVRLESSSSTSSEEGALSHSAPAASLRACLEKLNANFRGRPSSDKKSKKSKGAATLRIKGEKNNDSPLKMMKKLRGSDNSVDRDSSPIVLNGYDNHYVMMELVPSSKKSKSKSRRK